MRYDAEKLMRLRGGDLKGLREARTKGLQIGPIIGVGQVGVSLQNCVAAVPGREIELNAARSAFSNAELGRAIEGGKKAV
jgi:hypothetical protein